MNQRTKNQESLEQRNQKLLATMKEALKMQKTKSNRLARGQITSSHVKQLNKLYTKGSAAFGSIANLKKTSGLPRSKVVQYLQSKALYTKYKQFRKTSFPRLKAVAYRINEIWSVDVAYMDKIAHHNNGVKYLLVAVDVLSRYLRVQPMKALDAKDAVEAFKKMIKQKNQKGFGQTRDPSLKVNSKHFVKRRRFIYIQQKTKPSRHLLRGIFDRSKTLFTNTWRKIGLGLILRNCPSL